MTSIAAIAPLPAPPNGLPEPDLAYWRDTLAGVPDMLNLPTDWPRPAKRLPGRGRCALALPQNVVEPLASALGVDAYVILLAALEALLFRYARQECFVVAGLWPQCKRLTPLYAELRSDMTFPELAFRTYVVTDEASRHSGVGWSDITQALELEFRPQHHPLAQVALIVSTSTVADATLAETDPPYDLSLHLCHSNGHWHGTIQYSEDLFDRERILRLPGHLAAVLTQALNDIEIPIGCMQLFTEADQHASL